MKTYKLTYESVEVMHALFNKNAAKNTWTIGASTLRSFAEYFGASTEQLDISSEGGRATFMSYTERIMNGRGLHPQVFQSNGTTFRILAADTDTDVLKQPLQTSVTIDSLDFEEFKVEEQLHIGINVKDFKAIVTHAETLKTSITALYSFPGRPMQLSYREHGMQCEFTLMTIGDYRGGSVTPAPAAVRQVSTAPAESSQSRQSTVQTTVRPKPTNMPPPSQPLSRSLTRESQSQRIQRPSPPPPKASLDPNSLFLPAEEDDDRMWGERNYDDEQDTLGWDASANNVSLILKLTPSSYRKIGSKLGRSKKRTAELFEATTLSGLARRSEQSHSADTEDLRSMSCRHLRSNCYANSTLDRRLVWRLRSLIDGTGATSLRLCFRHVLRN